MVRVLVLMAAASVLFALDAVEPRETSWEGQNATVLSSGTIDLTVLTQGAAVASLVLTDEGEPLDPLWNPLRLAREAGKQAEFDGAAGHFLTLDGLAAPGGEVRQQAFSVSPSREEKASILTVSGTLPRSYESMTRTYKVVDGESVVTVDTVIENLQNVERPLEWMEEATFGAPFIVPGVSAVDISGTRSVTKRYDPADSLAPLERRLLSEDEFTWPMVTGVSRRPINLRNSPGNPRFVDDFTTLLNPSREFAFVTVINTFRQLVIGYVFRTADYPWIRHWGYFPSEHAEVRRIAFGTEPLEMSQRDAVSMGSMWDAPVYRKLPARGKLSTRFLMFTARTPDGFRKVDDVRLENGELVVEDKGSGKTIRLAASSSLTRNAVN